MSNDPLTQLGRPVRGFDSPDEAVLERVPNPQKGQLYLARFTAPAPPPKKSGGPFGPPQA